MVSVGTLELLGRGELAAVLAHERAHLRERHDLVLLPFTALRRAFPRSATCAGAHRAVALLVEMLADDRALRGRPTPRAGVGPGAVRHGGHLPGARGRAGRRGRRHGRPGHPPASAGAAAARRRESLAICLAAALLVAATITLLIV